MPNLDPWINHEQNNNNYEEFTRSSKFENHLLSIRDERQEMSRTNCLPTYNKRDENIIEMIDWTLEKYRDNIEKSQQNEQEQVIIDIFSKNLIKKEI
jgi:hypothetical protein